jgi:hybrid cluster-associated redox disulfide protein
MNDLNPNNSNKPIISADLDVDGLLSAYPQVATVLLRHKMACTGCYISHLHTLAEIAAIYRLDLNDFLDELRASVEEK